MKTKGYSAHSMRLLFLVLSITCFAVSGLNAQGPSCVENFDGVTAPALPAGWSAITATGCAGSGPWATTTAQSSNGPNSIFVNNADCVSDEYLISPSLPVVSPAAAISFKLSYSLETLFDGMVLEISVNGGPFQDVLAAGCSFSSGGYDAMIDSNYGNPIAGRMAWTGSSFGFITNTVDLPSSFNGQMIQLRWRRATDSAMSDAGVYLDDISFTGISCNTCTIIPPANITVNNTPGQCGAIVNYPAPTNGGYCGTITTNPASGSFFPVGTTNVTAISSANGGSASFTVTVNDTQVPVITCPANITVNNTPGQCGANVTFTAPAATDNCPGVTVTSNPLSGSFFPVGTTTVTSTATDLAGNITTCTFNIIVNNTQSSGCWIPGSCNQNFDSVSAPSLPNGWTAVTDRDDCGLSNPWVTTTAQSSNAPNSVYVNDPGCVSDERLISPPLVINSGTAVLNFKSRYNLQSGVSIAADGMVLEISVNGGPFQDILAAGGSFAAGGYNRTIANLYSSPISDRQAWSGNSGGFVTTTVNLPASANGQTIRLCWRRCTDIFLGNFGGVYIDDITYTGISCSSCFITQPANINISNDPGQCGAIVNYSASTTSGNCGPVTTTPVSGSFFPLGTTTVTVASPIGEGYTTFTVTVHDTAAPVLTCPANIIVNNAPGQCGANVTFTPPTATDNCPGAGIVTNHVSGSFFPVGITTVTSTATDSSGNSATCSFTITVNNTPTSGCWSGDSCHENFDMVTAAAMPPGWTGSTLTDCAGSNPWSTTTAQNSSAPNSVFVNAPPCISDEVLISPPLQVTSATATVSFIHNYDLEDTYDGMVLEISVNGGPFQDILLAGASFTSGGYNAPIELGYGSAIAGRMAWTGNSGGFIATSLNLPSSANGQTIKLRWRRCTDYSTSATGVYIDDISYTGISCPCVIAVPADIFADNDPGQCGAIVNYPAPTGSGGCGTVTSTPASGSYFPVGTTTVTATSSTGISATFRVNVQDNEDPVITCPANITVNNAPGQCGAIVTYVATATDNCPGVTISGGPASGSFFPAGTTIVRLTAADASGNEKDCAFNVTVIDTQAPVITCPANITVNNTAGQCGAIVTFAPTVTDNCPGVIITNSPASGSLFPVGTTTVTSIATDPSGNKDTCTFTVKVNDTQVPVITNCPANITVLAAPGQCGATVTFTAPTATDNCPGVTMTTSHASGSFFPGGLTTVTSIATDASGNKDTCVFTVTVNLDLNQNFDGVTPPALPAGWTLYNIWKTSSAKNVSPPNSVSFKGYAEAYSYGYLTSPAFTVNSAGSTVSFKNNFNIKLGEEGMVLRITINGGTWTDIIDAGGSFSAGGYTGNITILGSPLYGHPAWTGNSGGFITTTVNLPASAIGQNVKLYWLASFYDIDAIPGQEGTIYIDDIEFTDISCPNCTITTPQDITVSNTPGQCGAIVNYAAPTGTGSCGTITSTPASGSFFPVGTTTVTATSSLNGASSSFTVTVNDTQAPVITCPANITVNNTTGQCGAKVTFPTPVATDNCPGIIIGTGPASGSFYPVGTTTVYVNASDASGNNSSCTFTVTVKDTELPVITCPANITVNNTAGQCGAIVTFAPTVTDNCDGTTITSSPASGSLFPVGTTTVTSRATDAAGNTATCTFTVTVNDTQAPVITCPANITVNNTPGQCGANVIFTAPTATDNCPGVTVVTNHASGSPFQVGTTTVTSTATDAAGNISTCSFTVTVNDTEPPVIVCPANIIVSNAPGQCGANVTFAAPVATDNCPGVIVTTSHASGNFFPIGITTVTATATDATGNISTCTFTIRVNDTQLPVITCPANITVSNTVGQCGANVTFVAPTATDNCPGVIITTNPASGSFFPVGTTTVTATATDAAGNIRTCTFNIRVNDTQLPVITCPANITVSNTVGQCGANVTFAAPVATDNCPGVIVTTSHTSGSFFPVGITTVTATATDAAGNISSCTFTIRVNDAQLPVITCPANITVSNTVGQCGANVTFTAPVATDNCPGVIVTTSHASGSFFPVGITTVTATATDAAGNISSCTFTIRVNDTQLPVITCPANITVSNSVGQCGANVTFAAPVATDNCPGVIVTTSHASGSFFPVGITTVTATATDAAGNISTCTFTIRVNDTEVPVITCPANITTSNSVGQCGANVTFPAPVATDNCPGVTVTTSHVSGSFFPVGITTVAATATDAAGNTRTCIFTIRVNDTELPVITCPLNVTVSNDSGQCGANVTFSMPTATDNCPGVVVVTSHTTGSFFPVGTTTVTSTATDAAGNVSTCSFTITVIDTELPVITCPTNITVSNDAGQCGAIVTFTAPAATDNCPGVTVVTSHASGDFFPVGTTTVTSTATDVAGNISTCSFTIRVNDTEVPVITCPPDITVITPLGSCTATVSYSVTATDNCPAVITTLMGGLASGSAFPIGVNTVSWKATDAAGNISTCSFTVTVLDGQLPVISTQPVNITSCSGEKATFSVVATNVLSYQWQSFDGSTWNDIAGATSATCAVNTVNTGMNTQSYRVILTGLCSVVTSDHATLYVNLLPVIHLSASPFTALMPGRTTTLTATAIPAGGSYAWYKNETLIPGISSGSLTGLDVDAIGKYFVVYTDPNGCIDSSAYIELTGAPSAKLFVYPNPNQGRFQVRYYNGMNETVTLTVYDEKGSRIYTRKLVTTISYSSIEVNLGANFSSGTYIIELRDADNNQIAAKRVIVLQ